jgi:hypothetical protein
MHGVMWARLLAFVLSLYAAWHEFLSFGHACLICAVCAVYGGSCLSCRPHRCFASGMAQTCGASASSAVST